LTRQQLHEIVDQVPESRLLRLAELIVDLTSDPTEESEQAWQDPDYQAYVLERIEKSEASLARGEGIPMQEAQRRFARWLD
jgi:hypothetical protein